MLLYRPDPRLYDITSSIFLCVCSIEHWYIKWSMDWSPLPQGQFALSRILKRLRYALVLPWPVTISVRIGVMSIFSFCLSWAVGKKTFVIPTFSHASHSFCHFSFVSSFILLIRVLNGSLLKTILASLSLAAALASRLASLFPTIPTWALTHDNSIFQYDAYSHTWPVG